MLIVDYMHLRASEVNVLCAEDGEMGECWWERVVRYSKIGNAVCWNCKTEVVIRFAWLYHPNQMKAMTEIENMNKERSRYIQENRKERTKSFV